MTAVSVISASILFPPQRVPRMCRDSKLSPSYTSATPQEDDLHLSCMSCVCVFLFSFKHDLAEEERTLVTPTATNWTSAVLIKHVILHHN